MTPRSGARWAIAVGAVALAVSSVAYAASGPAGGAGVDTPPRVAVVVDAGGQGGAAAVRAARRGLTGIVAEHRVSGTLRVPRSPTEQRSALIGLAEARADVVVAVGLETPGTIATLARRRPATRIVAAAPAAAQIEAAMRQAASASPYLVATTGRR